MPVEVLSSEAASTIIEISKSGAPILKNFFDVFGTSGCLLDCERRRTLEQQFYSNRAKGITVSKTEKKKARWARDQYVKQYYDSHPGWFTAADVTASSSQGCGSCTTLQLIIKKVFLAQDYNPSGTLEYSVSRTFEVRQRSLGKNRSEKTIQLFQPPDSSVQFERFPVSKFLFGRDASMAQLRDWLNICLSSHKNCPKYVRVIDDDSRPSRLLDIKCVQRGRYSGIRLVETASGSSYQYACLSHRWDDAIQLHRTLVANVAEFQDFVRLEELPRNFQDAVSIARALDIPYLWIDSLCIIQDDGEAKLKELAKMGLIYQNSHLTIAAVSSPNSSDGCFIGDQWPDLCFSASDTTESHLIGARVLDRKGQPTTAKHIIDRYPLFTRGWVMQERLLSSRLLRCSYGEFAFDCLESSICQCNSTLAPHPHKNYTPRWFGNPNRTNDRRLLVQNAGEDHKSLALNYWKVVIETYMQLDLSFPSDILPAIGGCAQAIAVTLKLDYVAGMWNEKGNEILAADLLWFVIPQTGGVAPKARPEGSTAPSWSWASVSMGQSITHIAHEEWITRFTLLDDAIKEVHCKPCSATNPFGQVEGAYLKLKASLYPWYLRLQCRTTLRDLKRHRTKDLHVQRDKFSTSCGTDIKALEIGGATVEIRLDASIGGGRLTVQPFMQCIGTAAYRCGLAQIHLLHALHKDLNPGSFDVFLLLLRTDSAEGKPNCYRRIGLVKWTNEEKTWKDIIRGRIEPESQVFWLF